MAAECVLTSVTSYHQAQNYNYYAKVVHPSAQQAIILIFLVVSANKRRLQVSLVIIVLLHFQTVIANSSKVDITTPPT